MPITLTALDLAAARLARHARRRYPACRVDAGRASQDALQVSPLPDARLSALGAPPAL